MLTVHELRKRGFKVRVRHHRCFKYGEKGVSGCIQAIPLSKGGSTEVFITLPPKEGVGSASIVGVAECNPKDDFNRKRGVRIALGRALKKMGMPTK